MRPGHSPCSHRSISTVAPRGTSNVEVLRVARYPSVRVNWSWRDRSPLVNVGYSRVIGSQVPVTGDSASRTTKRSCGRRIDASAFERSGPSGPVSEYPALRAQPDTIDFVTRHQRHQALRTHITCGTSSVSASGVGSGEKRRHFRRWSPEPLQPVARSRIGGRGTDSKHSCKLLLSWHLATPSCRLLMQSLSTRSRRACANI
jgi:hypothetical protein